MECLRSLIASIVKAPTALNAVLSRITNADDGAAAAAQAEQDLQAASDASAHAASEVAALSSQLQHVQGRLQHAEEEVADASQREHAAALASAQLDRAQQENGIAAVQYQLFQAQQSQISADNRLALAKATLQSEQAMAHGLLQQHALQAQLVSVRVLRSMQAIHKHDKDGAAAQAEADAAAAQVAAATLSKDASSRSEQAKSFQLAGKDDQAMSVMLASCDHHRAAAAKLRAVDKAMAQAQGHRLAAVQATARSEVLAAESSLLEQQQTSLSAWHDIVHHKQPAAICCAQGDKSSECSVHCLMLHAEALLSASQPNDAGQLEAALMQARQHAAIWHHLCFQQCKEVHHHFVTFADALRDAGADHASASTFSELQSGHEAHCITPPSREAFSAVGQADEFAGPHKDTRTMQDGSNTLNDMRAQARHILKDSAEPLELQQALLRLDSSLQQLAVLQQGCFIAGKYVHYRQVQQQHSDDLESASASVTDCKGDWKVCNQLHRYSSLLSSSYPVSSSLCYHVDELRC